MNTSYDAMHAWAGSDAESHPIALSCLGEDARILGHPVARCREGGELTTGAVLQVLIDAVISDDNKCGLSVVAFVAASERPAPSEIYQCIRRYRWSGRLLNR